MTRRERARNQMLRCEVKAFVPGNARLVEIAAERTEGMATYYFLAARSGTHGFDDLRTLARSCYLQGIRDAVDAVAKAGQS